MNLALDLAKLFQLAAETIHPTALGVELVDLATRAVQKIGSTEHKIQSNKLLTSLIGEYTNSEKKIVRTALLSQISIHLTLKDVRQFVDSSVTEHM